MLKPFAGFGAAALIALGIALGGSTANAESVMKQCGDQWAGRQSRRNDERPDLAAIPLAMQGSTEDRGRCAVGRRGARTCGSRASASGHDKDRQRVRSGIRGEQGRDQSFGTDEARLRRRLPRGQ